MTFQAYLDNIKAQTGKSPEDFVALAAKRNITAHGEIVAWLKSEFALGHGHANAIATFLKRVKTPAANRASGGTMDALFSGTKSVWRAPTEELLAELAEFGPDFTSRANETYVNLIRGAKKFGIVQPASSARLDIGIKRKGVESDSRFESAGRWNAMVTHRVKVAGASELDAELVCWLRAAYDVA